MHHIVIEDLEMTGLAGERSIVGIASYTPSWDWVIRGNRILEAGTGLYLGNSDGRQPFVRGLIEHNIVVNPLGYCMQIKHQNSGGREGLGLAELPDEATTIIRYNVFAKPVVGATPRPNLLLGHFPESGSGRNDQYLVYGNFLYENSTENLFQGEGNIALYSNVFVNRAGGGALIRPHNGVPGDIDVFHNTFLVAERALRVTGGDPERTQTIHSNISYAGQPISGDSRVTISDNLEGTTTDASATLVRPDGAVGVDLDLHPLSTAEVDGTAAIPAFLDVELDFDRNTRSGSARGAYVPGASGWQLSLTAHP
ncbi:MAG TPA: hypothetical protein ENK57_04325 [Polyangiaceae bacterium]|nr:hypothetical protein [Polyangiaceae bacterium]